MRIVIRILGAIVIAWAIAAIVLFFFEDKLIYQPTKLESSYTFSFPLPFQEITLSHDSVQLSTLYFPADSAKGLVIYFHGNRDNLARWGKYATDFNRLGYEVLMPDYRGYGKSTGEPSEEKLYNDAHFVYTWSKKNIPSSFNTVIYGRSLGTGVASELAPHSDTNLLILETPFDEVRGSPYPWIRPFLQILPLKNHYPVATYLQSFAGRVVIFHGTDDWVVPPEATARLKPYLKDGDLYISIEGASHQTVGEHDLYHQTLEEVLVGHPTR